MIYIFNKNQSLIDEIYKSQILEAYEEMVLNGQIKSIISIPYKQFKKHKKEIRFFGYKRESNFFMYKILNYKKENSRIELEGIHILFDDLKGRVIDDKRFKEKTVKNIADVIFDKTDWQVFSTAKSSINLNLYRISSLEAFYKLLKEAKCEYRVNLSFSGGKLIKKIYFEDHISKDYGKWYEYGDKLVSVVAEENHSNIFTAFIGLGKGEEKKDEDGNSTGGYGRKITFEEVEWLISKGNPIEKPKNQNYIEIKEMTNYFGYPDGTPKITYVDFSEIDDKEKLLQATYEYALENSRPKLQLKALAFDTDRIELGEIVAIIRPDLDIRYKTRIFKIKTNLLNEKIKSFEFGDKVTVSQVDRIRAEKEEKQKQFEQIESLLESRLKDINLDYFNEDGYTYNLDANNEYNLPAGIYSFDKPINENPTKVVYLGAGKVLISNEKGTDGAWKWQTAIDGNGVAGESIVTNSITVNKLAADVGESLDLSSNKSIISSVKGQVTEYITENKAILKGDPGANGKDGTSTYVHIAYARSADGSLDFSLKPGEREYIGILVDNNSEQSKDYQKYIWSRLRGERGPRGLQGLQGENGKDGIKGVDGTSSYTHIAYANSQDGRRGFSVSDSVDKTYIGMYVDDIKKDSENPYKYKWTKIKGADGTKGIQGAPGENGKTPYLHIAYANSEDGRRGFSISDSAGKSYIGQYTDFNEYDSFYPDRYKWTKIKGEDGKDADYTQFRQQYSSELKQLQNSIELKVSRDIYDRNNTRIDSKFTSFKLSSTQIEAIAKEFIIKGFLKADEGRLGNWYISKNYIMPRDESVGIGTAANSEHQAVFWAGYRRIANENIYNFVVRKNGKLTAREAEIQGRIKSGSIIEVGEYGKIQATTNGLQINVPRSLGSKGGIGLQIVGRKIEQKSGMFIPQGLYIYKDDDFSSGSLPQDSNDFLMSIRGYADIKGIGYIKFNRGKHGGEDYASIGFWESKNVALGFGGDNNDIYYEYNNTTYSLWKVVKNQSSDRKLKENIIDTPHNAMDTISQLRFREYDWKKGKFYAKHTNIGLIAQEVEEVDESFVYEDGDILKLDALRLANLALKGIQELSEENKELSEENKKLKEEISEIKKIIEEMRNEKYNNN